MDFLHYTPDEQDAQMMEVFQHLAPLIRSPADKRAREDEPPEKVARPKQTPLLNQSNPPVMMFLQKLAHLVVQHDRDLCLQRRHDSFIFFMQTNTHGILPGLTQAAVEWKSSMKTPAEKPLPPLRVYLMTFLIKDLRTRVKEIADSKPGEQLWEAVVKQGTLLPDGSWPFMQWCHKEGKLIQSKRTPLSMQRLTKELQTLEELMMEEENVAKSTTTGNFSGLVLAAQQLGRRSLDHSAAADPIHLLEPSRSFHENELPTPEQGSAKHSDADRQGQGQISTGGQGQGTRTMTAAERHDFRQQMASMTYLNAGEQVCYANSAFAALSWALASRSTFQMTDWGGKAPLFDSFFRRPQKTVSLPLESWFQDLLQTWIDEGSGQSDSAEFTGIMLTCCSFQWEKRYQLGLQTLIFDRGSKFLPLTIQLDPALADSGTVSLDCLLRHWSSDMGMCQGLLTPCELICIHVDRLARDANNALTKDFTRIGLHCGQSIPVFSGLDLGCDWHQYHVISAVAHQGDTQGGHYQTLLAITSPRSGGVVLTSVE
eukprot:s5033_g1.t1